MFIKRCPRAKSGKEHVYWQVVESYRTRRGSRHRVVAYLGELSPGEEKGWARLATLLDGRAATQAHQLTLFSEPEESDPVPERVSVAVRGIRVGQVRDFGDVFLALGLWRMLELDRLLEHDLPRGHEEVPWALMACLVTMARFVEPSSELHVEDTWYRRTALPELLGVPVAMVTDSRLYRTLDAVMPLKSMLQGHLAARQGELFKPRHDLVLYDVTSTYFEGLAEGNSRARRGYSRDHRPDCKQVCIGLVVTPEGFPLGYEVFAGNRTDVTTLEEIVATMEARYGRPERLWVLDRGLVSEDNLAFLRARGARYIVGTPRATLHRFEQELVEHDWHEVQDGIEVQAHPSPHGAETFLVCRSADRREKERAIHERFLRRIETGLGRMAGRLARARRRLDRGAAERQVGRLLAANSRAAGAFDVRVEETPDLRSGLRLTWTRQADWDAWAAASEGCYLLRSNVTDLAPADLWRTYIQLTDVEDAFRAQKSDLCVRPIWHQLDRRVEAHILFSYLAYALWKTLQAWMERAGLGRGVRTVLEEFARIKAVEVILPTSTGRELRLWCVSQPDADQQVILNRLGLTLPRRLSRPAWVTRLQDLDPSCSPDF
jgi:hypothetical protein